MDQDTRLEPSSEKEQENQNDVSADESPRFGRLLIVLLTAVAMIVALTFATEAYYT